MRVRQNGNHLPQIFGVVVVVVVVVVAVVVVVVVKETLSFTKDHGNLRYPRPKATPPKK